MNNRGITKELYKIKENFNSILALRNAMDLKTTEVYLIRLCQALTKIRIIAHKFPVESGRFERRNQTERI